MKQLVKDLKEGDVVESDFRIMDLQVAVTKHGKNYHRFKVADKSGELPAVFWDADARDYSYKAGQICLVAGDVSNYQGKSQLTVRWVAERKSKEDSDFDKCTTYDVEKMWDQIVGYIGQIKNKFVREVAEDLFLNRGYQNAFMSVPAATGMHHAFKGGLLEHTLQMCECAEALLELEFFHPLNRDLCLFGILFHDYGKLFEYSSDPGFPKTLQGILVPHIPMVAALIHGSCAEREVPEIVRDHLMHVVLAHHGRMEWGSPVTMACPEAAFVHYVDNLHGTVFGYLQKIQANPGKDIVDHWNNGKIYLAGKSFSAILKEVEANALHEGGGF